MSVPIVGYGSAQNAIKEIDMQIVYRRLEARKKNITKDGKMSRKQMASAYRGYHGLEAQYHAMARMSDEAMMGTKARNDHLNLKLNEDMKSLEGQRRTISRQSRKEIETISEEFRAQLAYQYVYKNHSFKRFDSSKPAKKSRPTSDKPEMYIPGPKQTNPLQRTTSVIRPLGSLRQMEAYNNELKLPQLNDNINEKRHKDKGTKVNMMGDSSYEDLKLEKENTHTPSYTYTETKSFPQIEGALGVEIKYSYRCKDDDKESLYSAPAGAVNDELTVTDQPAMTHFDMGRNLMLMRQKEKENYSRQRQLPATPSKEEVKKQGWRRVLPATPSRPNSVYPRQETNAIDHKKALRKEVTEILDTWDQASVTKRLEHIEKIKQMDIERDKENPPPTFDRSRPTSAILRDFQEYKKAQEEHRYSPETNQPILVKQITVQPRPESPTVSRRNLYSSQVQAPGKLKRTTSERSDKFSSVSRTISYNELQLPQNIEEIAANALLTAAQRIEKEKVKRNSAKEKRREKTAVKPSVEESIPPPGSANTKNVDNESTEKPRRILPMTPRPASSEETSPRPSLSQSHVRKYNPSDVYVQATKPLTRKKQVNMFDTSILARPVVDEYKMIDEVQKANTGGSGPIPLKKRRPGTPGSYTEDGTDSPSQFMYMFSAKPIPQTIKQKMKFEYDNFSRTTPSMKKKLEVRAKNRRKIQQQNKILLQQKSVPSNDSDRASTHVSFSENVMVFQTI